MFPCCVQRVANCMRADSGVPFEAKWRPHKEHNFAGANAMDWFSAGIAGTDLHYPFYILTLLLCKMPELVLAWLGRLPTDWMAPLPVGTRRRKRALRKPKFMECADFYIRHWNNGVHETVHVFSRHSGYYYTDHLGNILPDYDPTVPSVAGLGLVQSLLTRPRRGVQSPAVREARRRAKAKAKTQVKRPAAVRNARTKIQRRAQHAANYDSNTGQGQLERWVKEMFNRCAGEHVDVPQAFLRGETAMIKHTHGFGSYHNFNVADFDMTPFWTTLWKCAQMKSTP